MTIILIDSMKKLVADLTYHTISTSYIYVFLDFQYRNQRLNKNQRNIMVIIDSNIFILYIFDYLVYLISINIIHSPLFSFSWCHLLLCW